MATIRSYFLIKELVCKEVYLKFGEKAWDFLDSRLLDVLFYIRDNIGKPMTINTWHRSGTFTQRGLRCNKCKLVRDKKVPYISAHVQGKAVDFDVLGMTADQVRRWLKDHANQLPHPIRVEDKVSWVHIDVRSNGAYGKVVFFTD